MTRDKQLQVRIESDIRESFKELCQQHDVEMGAFLYGLIRQFVDRSLPIENFIQPNASALPTETLADLKQSILAEVDERIKQAIAAITPPPQTTVTPAETVVNPVTVTPLKTQQGELMEVETAIKPSDIPSWLIPGQEYKQIDFVEKTGCSKSTVSDALTGRKPPQNPDLALLVELKKAEKLIKTVGGKWIYRPE